MINTQNYVYTKSHVNHLQFDLMHFAIFGIFFNKQPPIHLYVYNFFTYVKITQTNY